MSFQVEPSISNSANEKSVNLREKFSARNYGFISIRQATVLLSVVMFKS